MHLMFIVIMIYFVLSIYVLASLWAVLSIFLYGNRPSRSIAWLFVVVIIPIFGVLLYMIFGINRKRFKFFTLNNLAKRRLYDINNKNEIVSEFRYNFDGHQFEDLGKLILESCGFPAIDGNRVNVLKSGDETFNEIFDAINEAKSFIHLQYYIISGGKILDKLCKLLYAKLEEGVEVRIIYDALGSFGWKTETIKDLSSKGAKLYPILPFKIRNILSTINYRNHRKLIIIDGHVAFTGGVNITDKYICEEKSNLGIWGDLHLKIEGGSVDHLHRIFIKDYFFASNETLLEDPKYLPEQKSTGNHVVQIVSGGPDLNHLSILHQYVKMIHSAKTSISIQNPYFIPNKMLLEALKMASLRGVDVRVMVPKEIDSNVAKYSMQSNFEELLKDGVQICIVKDNFFHSKLIIVDGSIASIGSGNFDYRSFEHNYELNTLIYDESLSKELADDYNKLCESSEHLNYKSFKERALKEKLLEGMARIFSPLL